MFVIGLVDCDVAWHMVVFVLLVCASCVSGTCFLNWTDFCTRLVVVVCVCVVFVGVASEACVMTCGVVRASVSVVCWIGCTGVASRRGGCIVCIGVVSMYCAASVTVHLVGA